MKLFVVALLVATASTCQKVLTGVWADKDCTQEYAGDVDKAQKVGNNFAKQFASATGDCVDMKELEAREANEEKGRKARDKKEARSVKGTCDGDTLTFQFYKGLGCDVTDGPERTMNLACKRGGSKDDGFYMSLTDD